MQERWNDQKNNNPGTCLILFFTGILAGIIFVQAQGSSAFAGIFSEYFLSQYASLKIDYEKLLRYVGSYRCGQYALLVCCGTLMAAPLIFHGAVFLFGVTWGTMISISTVRLGLKGVLICAVGHSRKKYLILTAAGFFFLLFGIVTEVYINPPILQQILRKM